jgi:ribosome-binding ATPase
LRHLARPLDPEPEFGYQARQAAEARTESAMKVGLVGFAGVGKSTIFKALTGVAGGGNRAHLGTMVVPDARIDKLAELYRPKKVTYAEIVCVDVPGRATGPGQGLDSATLEVIRDCAALALVIGAFRPDAPSPVDELEAFRAELILADLMLVEKRIEALRKMGDKKQEREEMERLQAHLQEERALVAMERTDAERQLTRHYAFVSDRPIVVAVNVSEAMLEDGSGEAAATAIQQRGVPAFALSAPLELELSELEPEEQAAFLAEMSLAETARARFIRGAYDALDFITFLTAGDKEVHAWPIEKGATARRAAGRIHTDLERGFIRAEVFHFDDIVVAGSEPALKAAGKWRLEGKDYHVKDGDVLLIRHSG